MADPKKGGGGGGAKVGSVHKSGWLGWVAIIALVALTSRFWTKLIPTSCDFGSSAKTAVASESKKPEQPKEQRVVVAVKVKLHPRDWSRTISVTREKPDGVPGNARVSCEIDFPGWHQLWFWNKAKPESPLREGERWLGSVHSGTFRLRGDEGEAIIRLEYIWP